MTTQWRKFIMTAAAATMLVLGAGCQAGNNHLDVTAMVRHLDSTGLRIESLQALDPQPLAAKQGVSVKFVGVSQEIGIYRYDLNRPDDLERIKRIREDHFTYVAGFKYPVLLNGSFIVLGYEKNPLKHKIIEAVKSF